MFLYRIPGCSRGVWIYAAFVSCMYIVAMLLTIVVYRVLKRSGEGKNFKTDRRPIFFALAVGVSLALYQFLYTYAMSLIDGTFGGGDSFGGALICGMLEGFC